MPFTRRAFLSLGGSGLAAGSLLASLGCSRTTSAPSKAAPAPTWEERIADIEKRVRQSMAARQVPGVSMAIIRDGRIAWTGHFGVRDRTTGVPIDGGAVFSAQSMSKPVFAYRVLKLCELGVLDLDAPLTRYTRDIFVKDDPRLHEITARRILSHTTGLPNWRTAADPLRINFGPGSKWSYSGEGYHYLQSIVSRLTGRIDETECGTFEMGYRVCASDFGELHGSQPLASVRHDLQRVCVDACDTARARHAARHGGPVPADGAALSPGHRPLWLGGRTHDHGDRLRAIPDRGDAAEAGRRLPSERGEQERDAEASNRGGGVTYQDVVGARLADLASRPGQRRGARGRLRRLALAVGVLAGAQDRVRHPDATAKAAPRSSGPTCWSRSWMARCSRRARRDGNRTSVSQREHPHRTTFRPLRKLAGADGVEPILHPARTFAGTPVQATAQAPTPTPGAQNFAYRTLHRRSAS